MPVLIKSTNSVQDVNIVDDNNVAAASAVVQFLDIANSKNVNPIELSKGDFERNSVGENAAYFSKDDTNPLRSGLKSLDDIALIISGKSNSGVMQFATTSIQSTVKRMSSAQITEATAIVVSNLSMDSPITNGIRKGLPVAILFNLLSKTIAQEVKRGNRVYTKYVDQVVELGGQTVVEWSNNA